MKQIENHADTAGINSRTLRRARESIGLKVKREGEAGRKGGGRWSWELPEHLVGQVDHIKENGQLNEISLENNTLIKADGQVNPEAILLDIPVEKAIEIWRSEGAPMIHLGPGENCLDLKKLLTNRDVKPAHVKAVKTWLEKSLKQRG